MFRAEQVHIAVHQRSRAAHRNVAPNSLETAIGDRHDRHAHRPVRYFRITLRARASVPGPRRNSKFSSSPRPERRSSLVLSAFRRRWPMSPSSGNWPPPSRSFLGYGRASPRSPHVPVLLGAIISVHWHAGFFFTNPNGGWEYPALWIVGLLVVAATGDGALALVPTPLPGAANEDRRHLSHAA